MSIINKAILIELPIFANVCKHDVFVCVNFNVFTDCCKHLGLQMIETDDSYSKTLWLAKALTIVLRKLDWYRIFANCFGRAIVGSKEANYCRFAYSNIFKYLFYKSSLLKFMIYPIIWNKISMHHWHRNIHNYFNNILNKHVLGP